MSKKTFEELKKEAEAQGIALTGEESYKELSAMLKSEDDSEVKHAEKTYTESQVRAMLAQIVKDQNEEPLNEDEKPVPQISIPRFENKFIVKFKNMNTDEYEPDKVIHAVDVYNQESKQNVPYVTIVFDDNSEKLVPLESVLKRSTKIPCDLIERKKTDVSYDFGKVEVQEVKPTGYSQEGTGKFVKTKVTQFKEVFVVKTPKGEVLTVEPEVVNWAAVRQER